MRGGRRVKGAGGDYQPLKVSHITERMTATAGPRCRDLGAQRFDNQDVKLHTGRFTRAR